MGFDAMSTLQLAVAESWHYAWVCKVAQAVQCLLNAVSFAARPPSSHCQVAQLSQVEEAYGATHSVAAGRVAFHLRCSSAASVRC